MKYLSEKNVKAVASYVLTFCLHALFLAAALWMAREMFDGSHGYGFEYLEAMGLTAVIYAVKACWAKEYKLNLK